MLLNGGTAFHTGPTVRARNPNTINLANFTHLTIHLYSFYIYDLKFKLEEIIYMLCDDSSLKLLYNLAEEYNGGYLIFKQRLQDFFHFNVNLFKSRTHKI